MDDFSPPPSLVQLTTYLLSQTARIAKRNLDDQLRQRGLRLRHMAMLAALSDGGPTSQLALGRRLRIDPSDVTTATDELERDGLVQRQVDQTDRRRRLLSLTTAGNRCLTELQDVARVVADDLLAALPHERRAQLHQDLLTVFSAHQPRPAKATATDRASTARPATEGTVELISPVT
jgi:DNA-binding MarR family transcriptional regulator